MYTQEELQQISGRLLKHIDNPVWITSMGSGHSEEHSPILFVYVDNVKRMQKAKALIPEMWEGIPVVINHMGPLKTSSVSLSV